MLHPRDALTLTLTLTLTPTLARTLTLTHNPTPNTQLVKKCETDSATAEQLLQMLEKSTVVSAYKPDRRSRVVLQEPEYTVRSTK